MPAIAALAYLTVILVKAVATGASITPTQPRRTYVAAAVVGVWTLLFFVFGWRP